MEKRYNVLFLCTGNSARSIMAEAILNHLGGGRVQAFSAGSHPSGVVRTEALRQLASAGIGIEGLRSKSWEEFAKPDAPTMDFIFTVCDNAAAEACPVWPGHPTTAHWGVADPAAAASTETETARAFAQAYGVLWRRIRWFLALPFASLDEMALQSELRQIGNQ